MKIEIINIKGSDNTYPLMQVMVPAGFPSMADNFKEDCLSIDDIIVKNKASTFFAKVVGDSMIGACIEENDYLVIDKSIEPKDGKIAVCYIDGEFTLKRLKIEKDCIYLMPENDNYKPIKVTEENTLLIWGMVVGVIKKYF